MTGHPSIFVRVVLRQFSLCRTEYDINVCWDALQTVSLDDYGI